VRTGNRSEINARLTKETIGAADAAIRVTDEPAALGIDGEIVKVEQISTAGAGRALQAHGACLDRIVWRSIDGNPSVPAIIRGGDVEVPDVGTVQVCAVWIAGACRAGRKNAVAGPEKGERCAVVVASYHHRKHGMRY